MTKQQKPKVIYLQDYLTAFGVALVILAALARRAQACDPPPLAEARPRNPFAEYAETARKAVS